MATINSRFMLNFAIATTTVADAELLGRQAGRQAFQNDGDGSYQQAGDAYLAAARKYPQIQGQDGEALFRLHFCQAYLWS